MNSLTPKSDASSSDESPLFPLTAHPSTSSSDNVLLEEDPFYALSTAIVPSTSHLKLTGAELLEHLRQMSPSMCRQGLLNRFEELANLLAAGWKYHVANTDGVKEAWTRFEDFYEDVCSYTEGIVHA
uniref:Uncharacterized protein n=1 Tax=Globodera rostochiensis TaxID=31243 RepID=A0A914H0D8_GLORO